MPFLTAAEPSEFLSFAAVSPPVRERALGIDGARQWLILNGARPHGQDVLTIFRFVTVRSATSLLPFSCSSLSSGLARPVTVTL